MHGGNAEIQNQSYKVKELPGDEASWVCIRITVVLPMSPQGQCGVGSESNPVFKG